jgi:hypothetical protein
MVHCSIDFLPNIGHHTAMSEEAIQYVHKTVSGFLCSHLSHLSKNMFIIIHFTVWLKSNSLICYTYKYQKKDVNVE